MAGRADEAKPFLERALAAGRKAIEHAPKNAMLHTNLGNALHSLGRDDEGIAEYRKAIELDPGLAQPHGNLGALLLAEGKVDEAISLLRRTIELAPRLRECHHHLGRALRAKGRGDEAISALRTAVELEPKDAECHNELGAALSEVKGDYDGAIACFRRVIELDPRVAEGHCNLGIALRHKGRIDEPIAEFHTAIQLKGDHAPFHVLLADALTDRGKPEEAIAEYRAAIRLSSSDAHAHHKLGDALRRQGKPDEAIAAYRQAIRAKPDYAEVHNSLGGTLCDMKRDYPAAEAEFREAIRLKPDDATAHINLGIALSRQGKLDEAFAEWREAIRLKPDFVAAHFNLGVTLANQGKWDEAITAYHEVIRLGPDSVEAHVNLGAILCDVKHDYAGAEAEFRAAIRLRPDDAQPRMCLGNALRGQRKWSEAIPAYREAVRLQPGFVDARLGLGATLCDAVHDYPGAEAEFREVIRLGRDDAAVRFNLANALRSQGKYEDALAELRTARERAGPEPEKQLPRIGQMISEVERMAALATRLPALLKGEDRPHDFAERLTLALLCYDTKRHAAAARFWAEALQAEPKLADDRQAGYRYNAACAAALAGCGQAADDPKPDAAARARLRGQALDWLKAERAACAKVLDAGDAQARAVVAQTLKHLQADSDLAGVRERAALAALPEPERALWEALWADVDRLLEQAGNAR